jgi:stage V sporulation protein SpoVS
MSLTQDNADEVNFGTRTQRGATVLSVKGSSDIHKLSGAIMGCVRDGTPVVARAIGAGAVNQAAKACAVARDMGLKEGLDLTFVLEFVEISISGNQRTAFAFGVRVTPQGQSTYS